MITLNDALDMAIAALADKASVLNVAQKIVDSRGEDNAPAPARQDVYRRRKLLAAVDMLKNHRSQLNEHLSRQLGADSHGN